MTSEELEEMFEGDSADMCAGKFSLTSMGGCAEGLACADPGARTPIGVSGNFFLISANSFVFFFELLKLVKFQINKKKSIGPHEHINEINTIPIQFTSNIKLNNSL
jgi:hypothetical protein